MSIYRQGSTRINVKTVGVEESSIILAFLKIDHEGHKYSV